MQLRNERLKTRLIRESIRSAQPLANEIAREVRAAARTGELASVDFAERYSRVVSNQIMKTFALGVYEQIRLRENRALFKVAMSYDDAINAENWETIYEFYADKTSIPAEEFYALESKLRHKHFTIAKVKEENIIAELMAALSETIATGETARSWITIADDILRSNGLDTLTKSHLSQVYRTNEMLAYSAAQEQFYEMAGFQDTLLQYVTAGDELVRPEHEALDGVIQSEAEWVASGAYPPNGYNCRCIVMAVAPGEKGKEFTPAMREGLLNLKEFRLNFDGSPYKLLVKPV